MAEFYNYCRQIPANRAKGDIHRITIHEQYFGEYRSRYSPKTVFMEEIPPKQTIGVSKNGFDACRPDVRTETSAAVGATIAEATIILSSEEAAASTFSAAANTELTKEVIMLGSQQENDTSSLDRSSGGWPALTSGRQLKARGVVLALKNTLIERKKIFRKNIREKQITDACKLISIIWATYSKVKGVMVKCDTNWF
ncbi:hypothetical protein KSP40_PGU013807 [Platanthera guangdongensis]|uniref:Uncharacterized protein n=1 Tax=Platanthera guangdongensis TaxID=2320717 RepID=A0ABR2LBD7_9ASPA